MYSYFEFGYMDADDGNTKALDGMPYGWIYEDMEARYEKLPSMDNRLKDRKYRCPGN